MKQFIKDYFSFNRRERNGILLLLGIIILLILYLNWSEFFVPTQKVDYSEFEKEIDAFIATQPPTHGAKEPTDMNTPSLSGRDDEELFSFDPNILSEEEWIQLGLKDWQIKAIEKYRSKAGDFYYKEDFKKLHVISDKLYQNLEP
ncbi:MAG: helix-hairpin-helix domain-containing protein, partial [Bacteroidia bacterium]|nr:helix-hairpin-helix domain-containing protein [Bacteroidia bacterium]